MKNLVFYVTINYPDRETFFAILALLDQQGVGYIELGIPVTDPYMDGAVIQQTHQQVLAQSITEQDIIDLLTDIRSRFQFKVVLMTYQAGVDFFHLDQIPKHLFDGLICVDGKYPPAVFRNQIAVLGQSDSHQAIEQALQYNHLFAYVVSGTGTTGSFDQLPTGYIEVVKKVKSISQIPVYVGFGIKSADDIKQVIEHGADGAIIGTEFIRRYQSGGMEALAEYLTELKRYN